MLLQRVTKKFPCLNGEALAEFARLADKCGSIFGTALRLVVSARNVAERAELTPREVVELALLAWEEIPSARNELLKRGYEEEDVRRATAFSFDPDSLRVGDGIMKIHLIWSKDYGVEVGLWNPFPISLLPRPRSRK